MQKTSGVMTDDTKDRMIVIHPPMTGDLAELESFEQARAEVLAMHAIEPVAHALPTPPVAALASTSTSTQPDAVPEIEGTTHEPVSTAPAKAPKERALSLDTFR